MSGRSRAISREALEDDRVVTLKDAALRLFVFSHALADDCGNLSLEPKYLAARVWFGACLPDGTIAPVLDLVAFGLIVPYSKGGRMYGHVDGWEAPRKPRRSRVPSQAEADPSLPEWFCEYLEEGQ